MSYVETLSLKKKKKKEKEKEKKEMAMGPMRWVGSWVSHPLFKVGKICMGQEWVMSRLDKLEVFCI